MEYSNNSSSSGWNSISSYCLVKEASWNIIVNKQNIYNTIYERAAEKGITIEYGPNHRRDKDYIGSGVRTVRFADSNKIYHYRDTLINIAIRLGLISELEYEEHLLQNTNLQRCPLDPSQKYIII